MPTPNLALVSIATALFAASFSSGGGGGCGASVPDSDAGRPRDAAVLIDAGPSGDAAPAMDGGSIDAAPAADAGPAPFCAEAVCDPSRNIGCPGAGTCVLHEAEPSCGEGGASGLAEGSPCGAVEDCMPGQACFLVGDEGRCARICCPGDTGVCADGERCGGSGVLIDDTPTEYGRCMPPRDCEILSGEGCEDREACYVVDREGTRDCRIAGTRSPGEACRAPEDCSAGSICVGWPAGSEVCTQLCRLGREECPEGRACVGQLYTPSGIGVCVEDTTRG